jgi:hypothetical protein
MLRVSGFVTVFCVTISFAQTASAYGTPPDDAVNEERGQNMQLADACLPRLSPQMAAAFGLPTMQGCTRG